MKCAHPVRLWINKIKDPVLRSALGVVPSEIIVPCGKCVFCRMRQASEWSLRLILEMYGCQNPSYFITLTFDENNVHMLDKRDVQRFMNSLRKRLFRQFYDRYKLNFPYWSKDSVKEFAKRDCPKLSYYAVGEYGGETNRPHYHIMLFNLPIFRLSDVLKECEAVWHRGFVKVEYISVQNCSYITKYMTKFDPRKHPQAPFRLLSLKPALGHRFIDNNPELASMISEMKYFVTRDGKKFPIMRSLRNKYRKQVTDKNKYYDYCRNLIMNDDFWTDVAELQVMENRILQKLSRKFKDNSKECGV